MKRTDPPSRIAHGYGNRRLLIQQALDGPVDYIEADIWYRSGHIWVRHERRLGFLPLLVDRRSSHPLPLGPWAFALPVGRWYLRLDVQPITLTELLEKTRGRRGLLLDIKDYYSAADQRAFAQTLIRLLSQYGMVEATRVCSQNWSVLQSLRQESPGPSIHYTIERRPQWQAFLDLLEAGQPLSALTLHRSLMDAQRARFLAEKGIEVFTWTVDDREEARQLLALGADGIISNRLSLLAELRGDMDGPEGGQNR